MLVVRVSVCIIQKRQILECLQCGDRTSTIATKFSCSLGVVEQLLSQYPQIVEHRNQLRKKILRDKHRASILTLVESVRGSKRGETPECCTLVVHVVIQT